MCERSWEVFRRIGNANTSVAKIKKGTISRELYKREYAQLVVVANLLYVFLAHCYQSTHQQQHVHRKISSMSINWVMLTTDGKDIVPLDRETIFYRKENVKFELDCSNG